MNSKRARPSQHPNTDDTNRIFYEAFAPFYEEIYEEIDAVEVVRQWLFLAEERNWVPSREERFRVRPRLLDIGCGPGWYLAPWSRAGFEVAGLDSSPAMLERARHRIHSETGAHACPLYLADARELHEQSVVHDRFHFVVSHFNFLNLFAPEELTRVFQGVSSAVLPGGLWLTDHARPADPLSDIEESYRLGSKSAGVLRKGSYDSKRKCYCLCWKGKGLDKTERYWFHNATQFLQAASLTGWKTLGNFEWLPHRPATPWKPVTPAAERILTIFRKC